MFLFLVSAELPFDRNLMVLEVTKKTNAIGIFSDLFHAGDQVRTLFKFFNLVRPPERDAIIRSMSNLKFIFARLSLCLLFLTGCDSLPENPPRVVSAVDLSLYEGLWYEIARLPVFFQDEHDAATAEYSLSPDGTVSLINTAIRPDGTTRSVTGTAVPVPGSNGAKLRVTIDNFFAKLFGSPPSYGNYWILKLADDYSVALVGSPNRETLWLLARAPAIPEASISSYLEVARAQGYAVEKMIRPRK